MDDETGEEEIEEVAADTLDERTRKLMEMLREQGVSAETIDACMDGMDRFVQEHLGENGPVTPENEEATVSLEAIREYADRLVRERNAIHMTRGRVVSSNEARECNVAILMMSVFTSLPDYVLKAALANDTEIMVEQFMTCGTDQIRRPRMRGEGFEEPLIDVEYRRCYVDELYQTVMRGGIRQDSEAEYHVFCTIDSWGMLVELEKLLPGFKLEPIEDNARSKSMAAYAMIRNQHPGLITYRGLARLLSKSGGNEEKQRVLRECAALLLTGGEEAC